MAENNENETQGVVEAAETVNPPQADTAVAAEDQTIVSADNAVQTEGPSSPAWQLWKRPKKQLAIGLLLFLLVLGALGASVESIRFGALNVFDKADVSVIVVDQKTEQPLAGVIVASGDTTAETNEEGQATLEDIGYGDATLSFKKEAYETEEVTASVDKGEFSLEQVALAPTGIAYEVKAVDAITGKAIDTFTAEIVDVEDSSVESEAGVATLNVPQASEESLAITVAAEGFNQTTVEVKDVDADSSPVELIVSGRTYFLSNKSGKIDVYSSNLDGSDRQKIVAGTGKEQQFNTTFSITPDAKYGVLQAARAGSRNDSGDLMRELYVINLETDEIELFDEGAENWQILAVENDIVVYTIDKGKYQEVGNRKIKSYGFESKALKTLVTAKSLDDIRYFDGYVLYGESIYSSNLYRHTQADFSRLNVSTGEITQIESKHFVRQLAQVSPGVVHYRSDSFDSSDEEWVEYTIATNTRKVLENPSSERGEFYDRSPSGTELAWIDIRDGKGTIVIGDSNAANEKVVETGLNVLSIVRWIDDSHMVVSISNDQESAQYIVDVSTGDSQKITDVFRVSYSRYYGYF